ncbi:MAG: radical SAM protein [Bacteroidales bacterium]|nr:radical SAM protein [Bacteroidales bacterium]
MNVLILVAPEESSFYMGKNLPPLAVGVLQGYFRSKNHNVKSYDLSIPFKEMKHKKSYSYRKWIALFKKDSVFELINNSHLEPIEDLVGELFQNIDFTNINFVGISTGSGVSLFELHFSLLIGKYIQCKYNLPVVFGGINISHIFSFKTAFKELWELISNNFKYIFVGSGESSFEKLVSAYASGNAGEIYLTLEGAVYYKEGNVYANKQAYPSFICPDFDGFSLSYYTSYFNPENLEENIIQYFGWPFPYNNFAKDVNKIKYQKHDMKEVFLPYYFNHHCPYNCAFCSQSDKNKLSPCSKDSETVLKDIECLVSKYKTKYIHFVNNTFNYTPSFVRGFCEGIIKRNIEIYWSDCARVNNLTKELLELMYKAGCRKLVFGFETGSKKLQKYINKKLDIDQLYKVLTLCHEIGIMCDLEVIIGFPYETEDDFMDTYNFLDQNREYINYFYLNRYFVVPESLMGTYPENYNIELFEVQDYNIILNKNKNLFLRRYNYSTGDDIELSNLHIYSFNEINGRTWNEINSDINARFEKIYSLQQSFKSFIDSSKYIS